MDRMKSIVVGVDFSEASKQALLKAVDLANRNETILYVVHVIEALVILRVEQEAFTSSEELEEISYEHLEKMIDDTLDSASRPRWLQMEVRVGIPLDELNKKVREVDADLLVLGTSGITSGGKGTGTLAAKCVRAVPTRVLLVRPEHRGHFKNIVACIDFSVSSYRVVKQAIRMAIQNESDLTLLHVYSGPWHQIHYRQPTLEATPDFRKQYHDLLLGRLERYLEPYAALVANINIRHELFDAPYVGTGIVDFVIENGMDLVVLGNKGHSNLFYVLMGTTAERIVRDAPISVLALKPAEVVPKVKKFLDQKGAKYYTIVHSPAYTAQEIASAARIPGRQLAKTVMVKIDDSLAMAVLPASKRVDFDLLKEIVGSTRVELASEEEFEGKFTDCEPGAMPPFGNLYGMDVYVADSFCQSDEIAFNAGSHTELIQMNYKDFAELINPRVVEIATTR